MQPLLHVRTTALPLPPTPHGYVTKTVVAASLTHACSLPLTMVTHGYPNPNPEPHPNQTPSKFAQQLSGETNTAVMEQVRSPSP